MLDPRPLNATSPEAETGRDERPLSVAYLSPGWPPEAFANGVIPCIAAVADELRRRGHRASILSLRTVGGGGEDVHDLSRAGASSALPRRLLDGLARRLPYRVARTLRPHQSLDALPRFVAEHGAQILEMEEAFGWASWARRKVGIPVVVRLHGPWFLNGPLQGAPDDDTFRRRVREEGESIRTADGVTAPSQDVLERTRAYYGLELEGAAVIPNPMPPVSAERRWRPEGCDPGLVLFVGRFDRHKGGDLMIDAFAEVAREFPGVRLCFVGPDFGASGGDGVRWGLVDYVRDRIPGALESGRVEWLGQQPSTAVAELRRRARVTVVCSRYETFGLTATEAMAHGCPLVATRAGALPEVVRDGVDGLLCRPDDPSDLARAIGRLLADPDLAARLGARAAEECGRRYHPAVIAGQLMEHYEEVITRRRGRAKA
ncbi:MAG: glycosyltransferase family 4 protein [Planctomycetaceae bacterium]|nr:glycosyltransferase family 4 protein [Planctomycetaceae bacterium]